jgi:CBS-domain-containing membrane protein
LRAAKRRDHATTTVEEIMRDVPRVDSSAGAFDTLVQLQGSGGLDAIVQRDGALVGVLSEADYAHAMTVQRGFRSGIGG